MLRTLKTSNLSKGQTRGRAPLRRPGAVAARANAGSNNIQSNPERLNSDSTRSAKHPLCRHDENAVLMRYEDEVKQAFDGIVPMLKKISAIQHESDFEQRAQIIARECLGFELPNVILADAWVEQLDMRRLFAWCVFKAYQGFCDDFIATNASSAVEKNKFDDFLQSCGFHTMDITPCADGRLAHLVRYVLRLPASAVRRKSYAGALFDVEDSLEKWMEIELQRFRESKPNSIDAPTRYLKIVAYHFSAGSPAHEGCAAHGSDMQKAAQAGLERLVNFRQGVENSFCCGASIDLLLIGVDTDSDAIRIHVPNGNGEMALDRYVDSKTIYEQTAGLDETMAKRCIMSEVEMCSSDVSDGMSKLVVHLLENNMSQIAYVVNKHGDHYPDIGHAERFIGAGVGFEEIQLRNLMYFAYLNTVEEAASDLDVGIKIFSGLNVAHGLPVPVVVRFDYHGNVPGARDRAVQRCGRVAQALSQRYEHLCQQGLMHVLQVARNCDGDSALEIIACSVITPEVGAH